MHLPRSALVSVRGGLAGLACLLVCGVLAPGCQGSAQDQLAAARAALADAAYDDALAAADSGLRKTPDVVTAWGLELVKLEAQARSGLGEAAWTQLDRLAAAHPERIPPTQYAATADQLRSAGDGPAAIRILDLGLRRHPEDAALAGLIHAAQSGEMAPAELEMLRSLGYVE
jgi:hypothetical protein